MKRSVATSVAVIVAPRHALGSLEPREPMNSGAHVSPKEGISVWDMG